MMKNNKKIARELFKIAKELCAASFPINQTKIEELIQRAINNGNYNEFASALASYKNQFLTLVKKYKDKHVGDFNVNQSLLENIKKLLKQTREKLLYIRKMEENLENKKILFAKLKNTINATIKQKLAEINKRKLEGETIKITEEKNKLNEWGKSLKDKLDKIYSEEQEKLEREKELHREDLKTYQAAYTKLQQFLNHRQLFGDKIFSMTEDNSTDIVRQKLQQFMLSGKITEIMAALSRLIARNIKVIDLVDEWQEYILKQLNDEGLRIIWQHGKQTNQKSAFAKACSKLLSRQRAKSQSMGKLAIINNNIKIRLINSENQILAEMTASNAIIQNLEKMNVNLDSAQQDLEQLINALKDDNIRYDETSHKLIDINGTVVYDLNKIFTLPAIDHRIVKAGIIDNIKNFFKNGFEKLKNVLSSIIDLFKFTKESQGEVNNIEEQIENEFELFKREVEQLKNF